MNLATWLNEQARLVRGALLVGRLEEAREALRFLFEDKDGAPEGMRPAMIIRAALYPMSQGELDRVWNILRCRAEGIFVAGDELDAEIRTDLAITVRELRVFGRAGRYGEGLAVQPD